jgi:hypothetical protein
VEIPSAELIRRLVLCNQAMLGSVNAARGHFQLAVDDLAQARQRWGDHVVKLITNRHASDDFERTLHHHAADEIKSIIEWAPWPAGDTNGSPALRTPTKAKPATKVPKRKSATA